MPDRPACAGELGVPTGSEPDPNVQGFSYSHECRVCMRSLMDMEHWGTASEGDVASWRLYNMPGLPSSSPFRYAIEVGARFQIVFIGSIWAVYDDLILHYQ